jgi:betaine-aldehyde dehydrogenase
VVFDDADIEAAAAGIATAGYFNAGQDCTAATRVIAGPRVYKDFVDALAEQARGAKTGLPTDEDVLFGPVNNANQLSRVSGFLDRTPNHARVVAGGSRVGERGYFFSPTVVADLKQDDEMIQNEIFGPVITVQQFSGFIGVDQGLWSRNAHGKRARLRLRVDQHTHSGGG